jgi:hypothetical protein
VSRGDQGRNASGADIYLILPVVGFGRDCGIMICHDGVVAERRDNARAVRGREPRERREIKMIIVRM